MSSVQIVVFGISGKGVALEVDGLPDFLVTYGEPGKVQLCMALEVLLKHIKHGSSLLPTAEMVQ